MDTPKLLLHINYFEQGQSLERACRLAAELGADGIEFRRKPGAFKGTDLEYLDLVCRALDQHPLQCVSFGGPGVNLMETTTPAEVDRALDAAEVFYRAAAERLPLTVINMFSGTLKNPDNTLPYVEYWHHGSALADDALWERTINGFRRLAKTGEELGLKFAFETHGVYLHDTIEAAMRLVNGIDSPAFGVLWDQANLMIFPDAPDLDAAIAGLADKLYYVHLKNWLVAPAQFLATTSLSGGIINIREQLTKLFATGYSGPICIEAPRPGDREEFAREDLAYLKRLIEDIRGG